MQNRPTEYKSKIKGDPIKLLEMIKENSLSFYDKKKAGIVIMDAIMNLMTTRQRDDEDLTDYTKHFKVVRDLCKEKYRGIFNIPMLAQKESTWASDQEGSYKTAYASFLSILYLKNGSNKVWFIHQEDGRRLCHRSGECLPNPYQGCTTYFVHP